MLGLNGGQVHACESRYADWQNDVSKAVEHYAADVAWWVLSLKINNLLLASSRLQI